MSDLNRDEFEVLFSEETAKKAKPGQLEEFESIGGFALVLVEAMKEDRIGDTYRKGEFAAAWWAWQAYRECLVIELPAEPEYPEDPDEAIDDSHMDAYHSAIRMRNACRDSIHAAGVKTK